jgi:hypothetical protein
MFILFVYFSQMDDSGIARKDGGEEGQLTAEQRRRIREKQEKKAVIEQRGLLELSRRLTQIYEQPQAHFSDVSFIVGGEGPIYAHRSILASVSSSLRQLITSPPDSSGHIVVTDIKPDVFRQLLRYIYTAKSGKIPQDRALELLSAAERFEVEGLISLCLDKYIGRMVNLENAFDLFEETFKKHRRQLSYECQFFIEKNFTKLLKTNREGFRNLSDEPLSEIMKSDRLHLSDEYVLFLAVKDWAECRLQHESPNLDKDDSAYLPALQARLKDLIPLIRFPMMSSQGLEEAEHTSLVPDPLLYEAFRHHVLSRDNKNAPPDSKFLVVDERNPRLRPRKYQTHFLWNDNWHGQHIIIEDKGRTVRKVRAGWYSIAVGDTGFSSGKHYWEIKVNGNEISVGVTLKSLPSNQLDNYLGATADAWAYEATGHKKKSGNRTNYGDAYTNDDTIGVFLDMDIGKLGFYRNGKDMGEAYSDLPAGTPVYPAIGWRDGTATIVPSWLGFLNS